MSSNKQHYPLDNNEFNNLDISYISPDLPHATLKQIFKHYLSSVIIYGFALLLIYLNPWYNHLLNASINGLSVQRFFLNYYLLYISISPIVFLIYKPRCLWESKNIILLEYIFKLIKVFYQTKSLSSLLRNKSLLPSYKEKQSVLVYLIKLFFAPQMVQFTFTGLATLAPVFNETVHIYFNLVKDNVLPDFTWYRFFNSLYYLLIKILFIFDTSCFAIGYITEAFFLRNKIRYVESSVFSIIVCIICYTPFNKVTTTFLSWTPSDDAAFFGNPDTPLTLIFRLLSLIFVIVYSFASIALFTRASNLTNRGTVTIWPYSMIRHPAYISKNIFWWLTTIPFFFIGNFFNWSHILKCLCMILSMLGWNLIYYFRAITEERLLVKDPEYQAYMQKVKYKFIPYIW